MGKSKTFAAGVAMLAMLCGATPALANPTTVSAENIRKLNIMLMVTSLRCRTGEHDFQSEYQLFTAAHQANLSFASDHLQREMDASYGERDRRRALDRIGVGIANTYGEGHPWLDCADLKRATLELSMSQDRTHLADMADMLLSKSRPETPAIAQGDAKPALKPGSDERPEADNVSAIPWWLRG